ncbi:hypothetical protein QFC21_000824 [Naganishia friedmannii]|uniref:Uncharacterized protein n=1 Tax=Naganishia friedmannii TaxID=89922 RepID=A0ACC2W862_9TREE|nr:hypothetical protein QFC21_000824 [Naganishia friedmannii]
MASSRDYPILPIVTSSYAPPVFDDALGSPSSPTGAAQLSTSPYKSAFSSFFRSMGASDSLDEDQATAVALSPPVAAAVATSADALIQLEGCLDALKRRHQMNDGHLAGSITSDTILSTTPSAGIPALGSAHTSDLSTSTELQADTYTQSAAVAVTAEETAIGMELANACGWIFTGLVLEIVSLATESRRAAEAAIKRDQPNAAGQINGTTTQEQFYNNTHEKDQEADSTHIRQDKGKQKEECTAASTGSQQGGRRKRRFSINFNIKEMLNLDDIEERLNENPQNVPDNSSDRKADWDTLCELLKHLVEIYRHEHYKQTEGTYVYQIPLDLVFSHNPALNSSLPVITPTPASSDQSSQPSSPVDPLTCDNGETCRTTLVEQREEIRTYGSRANHDSDTLDHEMRDRIIWVKACLACCLYLLARSESPSQLYLLQLQELLPTGISHIDYLVNDIASTFTHRFKGNHRVEPSTSRSNQRSGRNHTSTPPANTSTLEHLQQSPTKSQHSTLREHRRTLSAKPSSIFSFSSSIFSMGGRFSRPVKSTTSLPQLSLDAAGFNMRANPDLASPVSVAGLPSLESPLRRAEGSRGSALSILQKYQQAASPKSAPSGQPEQKAYGTWGRLSILRPFQRSPLGSTTSLPTSAKECESITRNGSMQSMTSAHFINSYPRIIRSTPIKTDSPPRLSDSITSEETNESHGLEIPSIKTIACTPSPRAAHMFPRTPPSNSNDHLGPRIRGKPRAFENSLAMPPLDSALAAAEKASVLTRKNHCAICGKEGYNFPACRKCKQHFCSRECRVGFNMGGDGKKHTCAKPNTQGSQFLTVPGLPAQPKNVG